MFTNTLSLINSVIIRRRNKNNRLEAKYAKIRSLPDTFNFLNFQTVTQILVEVWTLNPAFSTLQKLEHTCSLFMYAQQICIKLYYLSGTILRARFLTRTLCYFSHSRMNGNEVASFYDQNHESNHKNSMVGQSVLLNLNVNDKVQVYMFTHTGLQDKRSNHLTQFVGIFLRPDKFLEDCEPPTITNGIH